MDVIVCWIEHLAVEQDCRTRKNKPTGIYKADNAGAEIFGKVVEKDRHGKLYTLTIRDYGIFVVTKDVYDKVRIGNEVML